MRPQSRIYADFQELFGLQARDLTVEQLNKIKTAKLIEFIPIDSRIQSILIGRMASDIDGIEIEKYKCLDAVDWNTNSLLKDTYNYTVKLTDRFKVKREKYWYSVSDFLFWIALDDYNRRVELEQSNLGNPSAFQENEADFDWLWKFEPQLASSIVAKIATEKNYRYNCTPLYHAIRNINSELLAEMLPHLESHTNDTKLQLLSNPNTPVDRLNGLLRLAAKKNHHYLPEMRRPIPNDVLTSLPTITRLEALEAVLFKIGVGDAKVIFPDIKSEEEFRDLLFGSLTKYPDRVNRLIKLFKAKYETER